MGNKWGKWVGTGLEFFFEYETTKIVHIKSIKLGVINRLLQIIILGYIIGYSIVYDKGYQSYENPVSSVTTKVKGIGYANVSTDFRVFDVPDFVVPPLMKDSFFVMTNAIITPLQSRSNCSEDPEVPGVVCTKDSDCNNGTRDLQGNGVQTGRCVNSSKIGTQVCEIMGWCPVETGEPSQTPLFPETVNFTVLIKNHVRFPRYGVRRRNIFEDGNSDYLKNCTYHSNKLCPIFKLGTIFAESGIQFEDAGVRGAVVSISIKWECDFDHPVENCVPQYKFLRIDNETTTVAPGFNFRYANYWQEGGEDRRTLYKAYGILFIIQVHGRGGKFDLVPLITKFGSGVALLAIASVVCDIFLLYFVKMKNVYREKKYLFVTGDDAFDPHVLAESVIEHSDSEDGAAAFDDSHSDELPLENSDKVGILQRTTTAGAGSSCSSGAS